MALHFKQSLEHFVATTFGFDERIFTEFAYDVGTTPLSSLYYPLATVILYCILIPTLQGFMVGKKSPPLKHILIVHNLFLCVVSALLAMYMALTLAIYFEHHNYSVGHVFCSLDWNDQRGSLTLAFYINHLLKYYELLDSIFLALKHKDIGFLHAYHHPATLVLTWTQLVDNTSVQWTIIFLNLLVHVVMYFYYFMSLLKVKLPWKKCVTIFQIVQFVLDASFIYGACITIYFFGGCRSSARAAIIGAFIITSYLYLFIEFYIEIYNTKAQARRLLLSKQKKALAIQQQPNQTKDDTHHQPLLFLKKGAIITKE
jgi:hypothetical protein